jgi:2-C-methyl-D-erythritol 4-phosphate cytidylyltransferase
MGGIRKAFLELDGEPVLLRALSPFLADARVVSVAVALAPADAASPPSWLSVDPRVIVAEGGATRSQSVRSAIAALPADLDVIAVHDAARPLVTSRVVSACIDVALSGLGAVAGYAAIDTLKRVDGEGLVLETPDRSAYWHAQTPQAFPADVLRAAYADLLAEGTDDAALVERARPEVRVQMVDAGASNLKVTRPEDVPIAEAILRSRRER